MITKNLLFLILSMYAYQLIAQVSFKRQSIEQNGVIRPGANRMEVYLPLLKGKSVAVLPIKLQW
jgi:hypothetical protein